MKLFLKQLVVSKSDGPMGVLLGIVILTAVTDVAMDLVHGHMMDGGDTDGTQWQQNGDVAGPRGMWLVVLLTWMKT